MTASHPSSNHWRAVIRRRVWVIAILMAVWSLAIEARLAHLQVFRHQDLVERAAQQQSRSIETHPKRGEILDREGRVLAYSVDADTIVAVPAEVDDPADTTAQLCHVLDCDETQRNRIQSRLAQDRLFAYIHRHVSVETARRIGELDLAGIGLIKENRRFYPNKELAAHLLGYVGIDNQGLHGVEWSYDEQVRGRPGRLFVQIDAFNRAFSRVEQPPTAGVSLELTVDKYIQYIAERELRATVREHDAAGGSVVVMEPATGEILALANEPTFNPNNFALSTEAARRNRAAQDVYEPGSSFKIVTASAALDQGVFDPAEIIDVSPGYIRVGSHPISDFRNYGALSFAEAIVKSSNVGAIKVGIALGAERVGRYVRRFGFGQAVSRDFAGQSRGIVYEPSQLNESSLASVSIGYNISVTPLQMTAAMNAVANGGELVEPRLVRAMVSDNERIEVPPRVIRRAISPETASTLTGILEDVVARGTARNARMDGYTAAGKTGTAEKLVDGRYSDTDHVASFVGFVPSTRPRLTILVVIDDVAQFGGAVAAPAFKRIAEASLRHLGVPRDVDAPAPILVAADPPGAARVRSASLRPPPREPDTGATLPGQMPDLRGLSARLAIDAVTEIGLTARPDGHGFVVAQDPPPGDPIADGQTVTLELERIPAADVRTGP